MTVKIGLMEKGDKVLNTWENKVSILKKSGEVEIYTIIEDEDGLPRLDDKHLVIAYGDKTVTVEDEDSTVRVTTF